MGFKSKILLANDMWKNLSFFAYAPYSANSSEFLFQADWDNDKSLEIQYRPHSDSTNQVDLCVAKAVLDRDNIEDRGECGPISFQSYFVICYVLCKLR